MKLINQSHKIMSFPPIDCLEFLELCGRTCYKSEEKITPDSADKFVRQRIMKSGHHSVIEHLSATVRFITNRGVTHELVRHRLASYSQESTRYVNYKGGMEFIRPVWPMTPNQEEMFISACETAEVAYQNLLEAGWRPEQAREVLPNALKTEIVVTANFREWLHIFNLRTSAAAHPQIRELMLPLKYGFAMRVPAIFE